MSTLLPPLKFFPFRPFIVSGQNNTFQHNVVIIYILPSSLFLVQALVKCDEEMYVVFFPYFSVCFVWLSSFFYHRDSHIGLAMPRQVEVCPCCFVNITSVGITSVFGQSVLECPLGLPNVPHFTIFNIAFNHVNYIVTFTCKLFICYPFSFFLIFL